MRLREIVAGNLRRLRHAKGLSQEELADRAEINRNYVGMLEREQHAATIDMLEKLAIVLDIDPVAFFERAERRAPTKIDCPARSDASTASRDVYARSLRRLKTSLKSTRNRMAVAIDVSGDSS